MTVLRESPAGIISQKFLWLQFYLLFQCLAWGVKRNSVPLWRWKKSCLMLLAGFILLLSSMCKPEASVYAWVPYHDYLSGSLAGFPLDDFHCKIMRLCDIQDGCSVTLAKLSSAAVSMGFSSSAAFQTLLRFALGALLTGIYIHLNRISLKTLNQRESTEPKQWRTKEAFLLAFCVSNWIPCKSHILDLLSVSLLPCSSPPAASTSLWLVLNLLGYLY